MDRHVASSKQDLHESYKRRMQGDVVGSTVNGNGIVYIESAALNRRIISQCMLEYTGEETPRGCLITCSQQ